MFIVMDILGGDLYLNILTTDDEIDGYITKFINDEGTDARVLGVALDEKDTRAVPEYQVYISFQKLIYQMPLTKFGLKLADKMEDHLTATALCFVSDASIVLGLNLNNDLLIKSGTDVVSYARKRFKFPLLITFSIQLFTLNISPLDFLLLQPVIREPLWMAQFAHLVKLEILSIEKLEQILSGLVRLEAHRDRDQFQ